MIAYFDHVDLGVVKYCLRFASILLTAKILKNIIIKDPFPCKIGHSQTFKLHNRMFIDILQTYSNIKIVQNALVESTRKLLKSVKKGQWKENSIKKWFI